MNQPAARRAFLKSSASISVLLAGKLVWLTPHQAYAKKATLRVLTAAQAASLEVLADALVPGARVAGITHFIDSQLASNPTDSMLMLKYLGVPPPHTTFYQAAADAIINAALTQFDRPITELDSKEIDQLIGLMTQDAISDWQGPPASFVYFVLRSDAVDVVYGVADGFEKIGMPTMQHIKPTRAW